MMRILFLPLQRTIDNGCTHFAEQAINLLNFAWAIFMSKRAPIGGCLYVDKNQSSRSGDHICCAAYRQPLFLFAITYLKAQQI